MIAALAATTALGCLADNIYFEAAREPFEGKVAVAQVTMNRAKDGDVCRAVWAQGRNRAGKKVAAFSWTLGARWRPKHIDPATYWECLGIAQRVLAGELRSDIIGEDVTYYHASYVHPHWTHVERVARIGLHVFYRSE